MNIENEKEHIVMERKNNELEKDGLYIENDTNIICYENKIGKFHCYKNDQWIGDTLSKGLVWNRDILEILFNNIPNNKDILDIGAHIGTHSIPYAQFINNNNTVYSFEPQKPIFDLLLKNMNINHITNMRCFHNAMGHLDEKLVSLTNTVTDGISKNKPLDYNSSKKINYGGICLGKDGNTVIMKTIDSFQFKNVGFIKIDVEGSEKLVLYGAKNTIKKHRPYILFETKKELSKEMIEMLNIPNKIINFNIFEYCKKLNYSCIKPIYTGSRINDYLLLP